jgi:hypothetical protein
VAAAPPACKARRSSWLPAWRAPNRHHFLHASTQTRRPWHRRPRYHKVVLDRKAHCRHDEAARLAGVEAEGCACGHLHPPADHTPQKEWAITTEVSERVDPPLDGRLHTELLKRQHDAYVRRESITGSQNKTPALIGCSFRRKTTDTTQHAGARASQETVTL